MATEPKNVKCLCGTLLAKRLDDGALEIRSRRAPTVRARGPVEVDCPRCGATARIEPQKAGHEMRVLAAGA